MAMSSYQYPTRGKATVQKSGVLPVDSNTALVAQVEALTKMVKDLQAKGNAKCEICRGGHDTRQCPMLANDSHEQVNYAGNFNQGPGNAYGNSYNSGGRNQPDFTWKNGNPSGFNQHPHEQSGVTDERMARLEELMVQQTQMLTQVIAANQTVTARHDELIKTQGAAILSLDKKIGELADQLKERKPCDSSSNTEKNPKGFVNAVTTRCGKFMGEEELFAEPVQEEELVDEEIEVEVSGKVHPTRLSPASTAQLVQPLVEKEKQKEAEIDLSRVPYPARILQQKYEKEYGKFLELFRQLKVNLPFSDVLQHMPKYAKFLKDLLMKKKNWEEISAVTLSERCFAGSPKELPQKMSDPGSFTIPCDLGGSSVSYALADLGASINLMPYSIFAKLNLGEPVPTRMTTQLADRSVKYPRGIVQNVLVKIDRFLFPVDFVILDMEEDERVPLILGRPFLATARALIDVGDGRLTLQVENESLTFENGKRETTEQKGTLCLVDTHMPLTSTYVSEEEHLVARNVDIEYQVLVRDKPPDIGVVYSGFAYRAKSKCGDPAASHGSPQLRAFMLRDFGSDRNPEFEDLGGGYVYAHRRPRMFTEYGGRTVCFDPP
ncbi:hypothetical protein E3N88_36922 [Mikania micrantha]|uniref:Retrotransposon gag domain-containing protein n=1 Tax=Mikania micrantha TaxID=192012 RepID=A0A5N6M5K2_9ASTR|nr:hypothetical protein E3N88_36922 [Mikania micrantha]